MARHPFSRPKSALSHAHDIEQRNRNMATIRKARGAERMSRSEARDIKRAERATRAIHHRKFEVGPEPKSWPRFMDYDAVKSADPSRILINSLKANWKILLVATIASTFIFVGSALIPWALGIFLDSGIERGLTSALIPGLLIMIGMIVVRAIGSLSEPIMMISWMRGAFSWRRDIVDAIAGVRGGGRQAVPSGEIVAAATDDSPKIGNLHYGIPSSIAGIASFFVIAVLMIATNVKLGLFVAIGLPVAILLMTFLIKPLQTRQRANREERGKLTTLASDAVVGLRVLRGVGGEDSYNERYGVQSQEVMRTGIRAALWQSILGALTTAVPAIFTAILIGMGLWEVFYGRMTYGQLVAFYGYTAYLAVPVSLATQFFQQLTDARVGAERIKKVLEMEPLVNEDAVDPASPTPNWERADLTEETSGVRVTGGKLTAIVAPDPEVSAKIAEHLTRTDDAFPVRATWTAAGAETPADAGAGVGTEQSVALTDLPLADVRKSIVLSSAVAQLFQGRLRSNLNGPNADEPIARDIASQMQDTGDGSGIAHRDHIESSSAATDAEIMDAIEIADAGDIVLGLEDGLDGYVAERGRSLSGGQRQRLALARAVIMDSPVLVLIEPTSAVDSHTESRITTQIKDARKGRTTVIVSASPIVLNAMDEVILLDAEGHEIARGTHEELSRNTIYHNIVHRAAGGEGEENS